MKLQLTKEQFDFFLKDSQMKGESRKILWDYLTDESATTRSLAEKYDKSSGRIGHYLSRFYALVDEVLAEKGLKTTVVISEPEMVDALNKLDYSHREARREELQNIDKIEAERRRKEHARHLVIPGQTELVL